MRLDFAPASFYSRKSIGRDICLVLLAKALALGAIYLFLVSPMRDSHPDAWRHLMGSQAHRVIPAR